MFLMIAWCHLIAFIQHIFYKFVYGKNLQIGKSVTWRRDFSIMMQKGAKVIIGDNCFFNNDCSIVANNLIDIGGVYLVKE